MADENPVVATYHPTKNPEGGAILGVPLRSLRRDEWEQLKEWQRLSVQVAAFYTVREAEAAPTEAAPTRKGAKEGTDGD